MKKKEIYDLLLRFCNDDYKQTTINKQTKSCILLFRRKSDFRFTMNYRGITLTSITIKIDNALLLHRIKPEIENILRENQNGFRENRSTTSRILTIRQIVEGVLAKNLKSTPLLVDFFKVFNSMHRRKMEQILLAYILTKETIVAIMMLYRHMKVKVRSPDVDSNFFGVLRHIDSDYVLRTMTDLLKEYGLTLERTDDILQKLYPTQTTQMIWHFQQIPNRIPAA